MKQIYNLILLLLCSSSMLMAQGITEVQVRLSNPSFDQQHRILTLDVELQADREAQQLFGMNARFFYDAAKLKFLEFQNFAPGYGYLGKKPKMTIGNDMSGYQLFNLEESAAYINGAVQLLTSSTDLFIKQNGWTKYFEVSFEVLPEALVSEDSSFPSVIVDKRIGKNGSFLNGSDGLLVTLVEKNNQTRVVSKPSIVAPGGHFNWKYDGQLEYPFGYPVKDYGLLIPVQPELPNNIFPSQKLPVKLYQNFPNPFREKTSIGFYLVEDSETHLRVFDQMGKEVAVFSGQFNAGYNTIEIGRKDLPVSSAVLLYRLDIGDQSTSFMKMTFIGN